MIRNSGLHGPAPRRIAIIEAARPQRARMGTIANGFPAMGHANAGWTTLSSEAPESSANFLSSVIEKQNATRMTTPGLLSYTPASITPSQNVAPWNSWAQPNCGPGGVPPAPTGADGTVSAEAPAGGSSSALWVALGLLGAAVIFSGSRR